MLLGAALLARSITACAVALYVAGCGGRPAERYLLPESFAGYMEVTYQVPGAPSLPHDAEGFRIVHVPEDGKVATSEPMLSGESYIHEYYYVLADGSRQRAPTLGGYTITDMSGREQHRWYVFIG